VDVEAAKAEAVKQAAAAALIAQALLENAPLFEKILALLKPTEEANPVVVDMPAVAQAILVTDVENMALKTG